MKPKKDIELEVVGAGTIRISKSSKWQCGGKEGFSFGVSWGRHNFAGGVLSTEEAEKLAHHITKTIRYQKLKKLNNAQ